MSMVDDDDDCDDEFNYKTRQLHPGSMTSYMSLLHFELINMDIIIIYFNYVNMIYFYVVRMMFIFMLIIMMMMAVVWVMNELRIKYRYYTDNLVYTIKISLIKLP